jgi:hypothetical protein
MSFQVLANDASSWEHESFVKAFVVELPNWSGRHQLGTKISLDFKARLFDDSLEHP